MSKREFNEAMRKARFDLEEYVQENLPYNDMEGIAKASGWRKELAQCKTIEEINIAMKEVRLLALRLYGPLQYREAMAKAYEALDDYIDQFEEDGLEVAAESPIWRGELEQCETVEEIIKYMDEFSPSCVYCQKPINVITQEPGDPKEFHFDCWNNDEENHRFDWIWRERQEIIRLHREATDRYQAFMKKLMNY